MTTIKDRIAVLENILSEGWLSVMEDIESRGRLIFEVCWNKEFKGHVLCSPFWFQHNTKAERITPKVLRKRLPLLNEGCYSSKGAFARIVPEAQEILYYNILKEIVNKGCYWYWGDNLSLWEAKKLLPIEEQDLIQDNTQLVIKLESWAKSNKIHVEVIPQGRDYAFVEFKEGKASDFLDKLQKDLEGTAVISTTQFSWRLYAELIFGDSSHS